MMGTCLSAADRDQDHGLFFADFEDLQFNFSQSYADNDTLDGLPQPCHNAYCEDFGGSISTFLATASALGLLSNLALGVGLTKRSLLWEHGRLGKAVPFLMMAASAIFAAILPFFAVGSLQGWIFGDRSCQAAMALKYGCLFAQGLLVASSSGRPPKHGPAWLLPGVFWAAGFILAIPAAVISSTGDRDEGAVCTLSQAAECDSWSVVLDLSCLVVFLILPTAMVLATVARRWRRCSWDPQISISWVFYLLWAPYGAAVLLNFLLQKEVLELSCPRQKKVDYFLGFSEGLGILHCCICPLLILGVGVCSRKTSQAGGL